MSLRLGLVRLGRPGFYEHHVLNHARTRWKSKAGKGSKLRKWAVTCTVCGRWASAWLREHGDGLVLLPSGVSVPVFSVTSSR